jgi:hypothetical protein
MSHTTLNSDTPVVVGRVTLPRQGVWHADLVLDAPEAPTGAVTLRVGQKLTLQGTVLHAGVFAGQVRVRVVGGAGKLATELPPKFYAGVPRRLPLTDLCEATGERIASRTDRAFLDDVLTPSWTRVRGPAASALARLTEGWSWRILPDGSLWVGQETWPEATGMADLVVLEDDEQRGRLLLATEAPELLPGQTLLGRRVSDVELTIEPEQLRLDALLDRGAPGLLDRMKGPLLAIVTAIVRRFTDPLAWYPGSVVRTEAGGQLEVKLDGDLMPTITGVQLRSGLAGRGQKLVDGARVLLFYEGGDMRRPVALPFDPAALDEETITARTKVAFDTPLVSLDPQGRDSARLGDLVAVGGPTWLVQFVPGPGAPLGPVVPGAPYGMLFTNAASPTPVPMPQIYGSILTANGKVKS